MKLKKDHSKYVKEQELIPSDRIELIKEANRLVESMVTKTTLPKMFAGLATQEVPLTDQEILAYDTALGFLTQEFNEGFLGHRVFDKRLESETTVEIGEPYGKKTDNDSHERAGEVMEREEVQKEN